MMTLEERPVVVSTHSFRAMNTDIELIIYADDNSVAAQQRLTEVIDEIETLFASTEANLSRFRPNSELSWLNRVGHMPAASPLLFESVRAAVQMAELTEGIFDPTILEALETAGYDRSFEQLTVRRYAKVASLPVWPHMNRYRQIELDPASYDITLPPGLKIDLGGIGKGMTVDRASALLKAADYQNFVVNAGGDMYVSGCPPMSPQGWEVGVVNPMQPDQDITDVTACNQAVATSTVTKRRWQQGNKQQHHLIDPRTGQPVINAIAAVTVIAPSTQQADVLAKTALILGLDEGWAFIQRQPSCRAIFVTMNEEVIV